jgi:hypothetical protein
VNIQNQNVPKRRATPTTLFRPDGIVPPFIIIGHKRSRGRHQRQIYICLFCWDGTGRSVLFS